MLSLIKPILFELCSCVADNVVIIAKALKNQFVIPEFSVFSGYIDRIFEKVAKNTSGQVSLIHISLAPLVLGT